MCLVVCMHLCHCVYISVHTAVSPEFKALVLMCVTDGDRPPPPIAEALGLVSGVYFDLSVCLALELTAAHGTTLLFYLFTIPAYFCQIF